MLKSVRMRKVGPIGLGALAVLVSSAVGCGWILGLDEYSLDLCRDGVLGQGEEAVDCGGPCAPCEDKCVDKVRSGSETDVDCGGACGPCEDGRGCIVGPDCQSLVCSAGTCLPPACDDKVQNGDETDRDCGGACQTTCDIDQGCIEGKDCTTLICSDEQVCLNNYAWGLAFSTKISFSEQVAIDPWGNIILAGTYDGTLKIDQQQLIGAGMGDVFVAKFDAEGGTLWSRSFGDASEQLVTSLATDAAGNIIMAGTFKGTINFGNGGLISAGERDFFLAKLDTFGNLMWSKKFGDALDQSFPSIATFIDGSIALTGSFNGSIDLGGTILTSAGANDALIAKFDATGNHLWSSRFGDANNDQRGSGVAVDKAGAVILSGRFQGSMAVGNVDLFSKGAHDIFVAKLSGQDGAVNWANGWGSTDAEGNEAVARVVTLDTGEFLAVGVFDKSFAVVGENIVSHGQNDIFIMKLTDGGDPLWIKGYGSDFSDLPFGIALSPDQKLVLGGISGKSIDFGGGPLLSVGGEDLFLAELDKDGKHIWSRRYGGELDSSALSSVAFGAPGVLFATGSFKGTIDLGGAPLKSTGDGAIFLAKYLLP